MIIPDSISKLLDRLILEGKIYPEEGEMLYQQCHADLQKETRKGVIEVLVWVLVELYEHDVSAMKRDIMKMALAGNVKTKASRLEIAKGIFALIELHSDGTFNELCRAVDSVEYDLRAEAFNVEDLPFQ